MANLPTREVVDGRWVTTTAPFREYRDPQESAGDWWRLMNQGRYAQVIGSQSVDDAARAVAKAGYATDPRYAEKVLGIRPRTQAQQDFLDQRTRELIAVGAPPHLADLGSRQSAIETGWGRSAPGGNYFGIKGAADARSGKTMDYTQIPETILQGPFGGGQMPPLGPQPLAGVPGLPPQLPEAATAPPEPQAPGFMDSLMGDPMFNLGLGVLAAPGYGGNWLRGAATGAQQGLLAHQQRQKFEQEMAALQQKKQEREQVKKMAQGLPEPFRTLVLTDPGSYGNVLQQMMALRAKGAGPQGRDRYMEINGRVFDTVTQQFVQPQGGDQAMGAGQWADQLKPEKKVEVAGQMRDDFRTEMKAYNEAQAFYERGRAAAQGGPEQMTGADDIALVFSFMKLLDPTSVVRETEYATAANAAGVPSHVQAMWNNLVGGGKLDLEGRRQLLDQMERQYAITRQNQEAAREHYGQIAKELGIPMHWIFRETTDREYLPRTTTGGDARRRPAAPGKPAAPPPVTDAERELEDLLRE